MIALAVAIGAAIGAPARYLTDRAVQSRHASPLPWGTLVVNVVASFVLGAVTAAQVSATWQAYVGTGFCGALSTFSTLSFETVRLAENGRWRVAAVNVGLTLLLGLGGAALGWWAGSA